VPDARANAARGNKVFEDAGALLQEDWPEMAEDLRDMMEFDGGEPEPGGDSINPSADDPSDRLAGAGGGQYARQVSGCEDDGNDVVNANAAWADGTIWKEDYVPHVVPPFGVHNQIQPLAALPSRMSLYCICLSRITRCNDDL